MKSTIGSPLIQHNSGSNPLLSVNDMLEIRGLATIKNFYLLASDFVGFSKSLAAEVINTEVTHGIVIFCQEEIATL